MKIFRILLCLILAFTVCFSYLYGYKKIDENIIIKSQENYKGIISLWQIDTFEGGKGSRKQFLLKIARDFEKENTGVLIMVMNFTVEGATEKMEKGEYPDMISYGLGVETENFSELKVNNKVRGGTIGDKAYATAWCKGEYFLFKNTFTSKKKEYKNSIVVSKTDYNNPLCLLALSGKSFDKITVKAPLDAYYDFVTGTTEYFLGTQRDTERIIRREYACEIQPLSEFNDLYQYISILTKAEEKFFYCQEFINLLISEKEQKKLKDISMLSPYYKIEFDNAYLNEYQSLKNPFTLSAFTKKEKIEELNRLSLEYLNGKKDNLVKIKNLLI